MTLSERTGAYRAIWFEKQISDYRYTVSYRGAWSGMNPVTVTVRAGQVVSSEFAGEPQQGDSTLAAIYSEPYNTIPKLYALIEGLLDQEMSLPRVHYDKQYGFPANITMTGVEFQMTSSRISVWDFSVLK